MSHIRGHIEDPASSCGILIPDDQKSVAEKEKKGLYFVPPTNWKPKKGEEVGFLPLKVPIGLGQHILIAYDLIQGDHDATNPDAIKDKLQNVDELRAQKQSNK